MFCFAGQPCAASDPFNGAAWRWLCRTVFSFSGISQKKAVHRAPLQTVKKLRESARGPGPSRNSIVPDGVYVGGGTIFAPENPIFQSKNRFFAVSAPGNPQDFSGNW